ncbi:MAG: SsrA-binding protein SmpB [Planctomycetota bacterium]
MKVVARNKKAHREYQIQDKLEAGLSLRGTEVKSIRLGHVQLGDAYVQIKDEEAYLVKANISVYDKGSWTNHEPSRRRKLLLHKREIRKLQGKINERGLTVVPLQMYLNDKGLVKVEIGVGKGKQYHDKREDLKRRDAARDIQRAMRRGNDR